MKKVIKKIILSASIILIPALIYYAVEINMSSRGEINNVINKVEGKTLNSKFETKIKSGNLATDYKIPQVLSDIDDFELNTLNIPIVINIDTRTSSEMSVDKESMIKAISLIKELKGKKINIILEAYPWIEYGSVGETEWNPKDLNAFFENWKHSVLKVIIDEIAIPYHVDAMSIGTSFAKMEHEEGKMCDLVDYVKEYYKGLLTYRTNFWVTADFDPSLRKTYEKRINNNVFSKLDFISVACYFELTENETNTVDNLVNALYCTQILNRKQNVVEELQGLYDKWEKPIFFGELGFPRTNKASREPYNPKISNVINGQEQANCFEAYRRVFEKCPWNLGFSIFAIGEKSDDKMYYPSDESTEIIKKWYKND